MSESDLHEDDRFDAMLRELGRDVPCPTLSPGARERLLGAVAPEGALGAGGRGRSRWRVAAMIAIIGALGIGSALMGVSLIQSRRELATAHWETDEALTLLIRARQTQPVIPVPEDLTGVHAEDLTLITFDHRLCPIARVCTPGFRRLAELHAGGAASFMTLDVTGGARDEAQTQLELRGLGYALGAPLGAETGVVKVLDTRRRVVLSSAPGALGLEQAQALLARVGVGP